MPTEPDIRKRAWGPISTSGLKKAQSLVKQPGTSAEFALRVIGKFHTKDQLIQVGNQLIELAEHAYGCRQLDRLESISQTLLGLPLPDEYRRASHYFQALEMIRRGDLENAKCLLAEVSSGTSHPYTARAVQSLGAAFLLSGDFDSARKLQVDAGRLAVTRASADLLTTVFAGKNLAVIESIEGNHNRALAYLEQIASVAKAVGRILPYVYYDHQNSLAVEFGELGRLEEAALTSRVALSSPLVNDYPEWRQTYNEIASKSTRVSHSTVPVRMPNTEPELPENVESESSNLLQLTADGRVDRPEVNGYNQSAPARILSFEQWRTSITKRNGGSSSVLTAEQRNRMTTSEKLIRLMDLISQDTTDDETIDRILEAVEKIVFNRRTSKID